MTAIATRRDHLLTTPAEDDARVDEALLESFLASDAPPWTLGVSHPNATVTLDVSRPPSRDGFWKYILDWCEAALLVPLVVLATVGVGIALVFVVRLIVEGVSWVTGRIW